MVSKYSLLFNTKIVKEEEKREWEEERIKDKIKA
jgi:hypothetical protein